MPEASTSNSKEQFKTLGLAAGLGILGAIGASAFLWLTEEGQRALFHTLPANLGLEGTPSWWVVLVLLVGAVGVGAAQLLPGSTGPSPLGGFHFSTPLNAVPSVLLAGLATLVAGYTLGPEAPLIIVGTSIGALATRRASPEVRAAAMLLGGVAGISAVFGNPFITGFMLLEFMAMGTAPVVLLLPVLVTLATSDLIQVGIFSFHGLGIHSLGVHGVPAYHHLEPGALVVGAVVALAAGLVAVGARRCAELVEHLSSSQRLLGLGLAATTAIAAVFVDHGHGHLPLDQVLFSGSEGIEGLLSQGSLAILGLLLVTKLVAFSAALGGGMRGGPIFPAIFLGVTIGVIGHVLVPQVSVTAVVVAGTAASAAAMLKLPATAAMLGAVLFAGAGAAVAPLAIVGAVVGMVVRLIVDQRWPSTSDELEGVSS